jgi:transcriptional antiterminator RfaH
MLPDDSELRWYCIRSKPKRQNLAAASLRSLGIDVFNPQLRYRRVNRRGQWTATVPVFTNYLFGRFELARLFRGARYAPGVSDILCFGGRWAEIPEGEIALLRSVWTDADAVVEPEQQVEVGASVVLTGGLFHGMEATVVALLPARRRVQVLLEFLGGVKVAEVDADAVLAPLAHPLAV